MTRLVTTRDVYGPIAEGGPITRTRRRVRKLSAPRERTLTEFGLSFSLTQMLTDERDFMSAYINADDETDLLQDCGE